jgi:hypothetical protein
MPGNLEITLTVQWRKVDPTGENCALCRDPIFLVQWEPRFYMNGKELVPHDKTETVGPCLCQACYEGLNQTI